MESFTKYENLQIEELCRLCLTKKDNMGFICEAGIADMLLECASIQLTPENGLFNLVCNDCIREVRCWYVFKQQVVRSFEIGRWLFEKKLQTNANCNYLTNELFKNNYLDNHEENSNSDSLYSNCILEDVAKLEHLLKEHAPDLMDDKCNVHNSFTSSDDIDKIINSIVLNVVNDVKRELSTTLITIAPKRKKTLEELKCTVCEKQCSSTNSYNRHIKTHDNARPYVCSKCDKTFKTSQVLAEHMKRHYDDRRHKCDVCNQKFYAKASLNDHMRSHTGERPFRCEVCHRTFATKAILRQHMVVHTIRDKKYQCEICNKFLLTLGSLDIHKRKHTGIKPFQCTGCDKAFFTKEAMQRHFSAIHDTDNNFLCSVCSKVCSTKVHLSNHMKKKHLGLGRPANAICNDCGKQCGSAAELKVHLRVHTGERPYVCDICDKRFIAKGNLNSHKQRHTGKKPFLCNHCGKAFGEKSTLKVHERIHTGEHPYTCTICGKAYIQSSALRTHMRTHWK